MVPPASSPDDPHSLQTKAEEVRAYLVAIRGGAPFLSAADGRLLVRWLEQGISVARILAAVDETAERRRKKQTRSRLSLTACRRSIEKSRKKSPTGESTPSSNQQAVQMNEYACALEEMVVSDTLRSARDVLIQRIRQLDGADDPEWAATEAVSACRIFHEAAWIALAAEHDALREAATLELAALRNVLSAEAFTAAVDEVAHDMVRRQTPLVSAREVWDRVSAV